MKNENFEQWFKLNKNFTTPFGNLNQNANQAMAAIIESNLKCLSECMTNTCNTFSAQIKCLSNTKPEDLLSAQKECMSEGISTAISNMQKIISTSMNSIDAVTTLYSAHTQTNESKSTEKTGKN